MMTLIRKIRWMTHKSYSNAKKRKKKKERKKKKKKNLAFLKTWYQGKV